MIRRFRLFLYPINGLTKWLNKMSDEGYRLIKAGNIFYYFDKCESGKYRYAVDYVANKSHRALKDYERFLEESNIRYIEKPGNIGKFSYGSLRWRPFADKGGKIATSSGMINREFLILEKENDNKPFKIYTGIEDKINALRIMRRPTITGLIFVGVMLLMVNLDIITQNRISLLSYEANKWVLTIVLSIVGVLLTINLLRFNMEIKRLKSDAIIKE